ncbi:transmembrane protein, putative [Medicago truncatula]|uniref:Transmembrane protein, putative n=1 Tax=Medicago truncatula TaxID=3880 RepID=G7IHQ7_MEDTR|nr:transmembrane protein, putative [Medicago truncatula]
MEEDFEKEYTMFQDSFTLQLTEKSFHDVIVHTPLPPPPPIATLCIALTSVIIVSAVESCFSLFLFAIICYASLGCAKEKKA